MKLRLPPLPARPVLPLVALSLLASGASAGMYNFTGKSLTDVFWQLQYVDTPTNGNPNFGGQNFTTCCLKAVNDAVEIGPNGDLQFVSQFENWITFDEGPNQPLDLLVNYSLRDQFPCTAVYNGDARGAPVVQVNYTWLAANCPGWQVSSKDNLNAWLQPLSGFLVPAVVFCLSVPRRRKLEVPRFLFAPDQGGIKSYLLAPFGACLAIVMVSADTIVWLCICFAFAGPMIISGLYEAMLDNSVLEYLRFKIDESRLSLDMRCRCLMIILIGNLDLVWNTEDPDGNGGYVDGGTHGGMYVGGDSEDDDDQDDDGEEGDGSGFDNRRGRESSGEIPLVAMSRSGAYQAVPGSDLASPSPGPGPPQGTFAPLGSQTPYIPDSSSYPYSPYAPYPSGVGGQAGQGTPSRPPVAHAADGSPSPSAASVSPRSPAPAVPAVSGAGAPGDPSYAPQLPPLPPLDSTSGLPANSALPMTSAYWNDLNNNREHDYGNGSGRGTAAHESASAPAQMVVPPPPPPMSSAPAQGYESAEHTSVEADAVIPGLYISPASAGPDPAPVANAFQLPLARQRPHIGVVPGFPPGPATPVQRLAAPASNNTGTPYAGSGVVAAGMLATGVGIGVSHDTNQELLANHRSGGPIASPWQHMEQSLYPLRLYDDEFPTRRHSPRQYAIHRPCPAGINCEDNTHNELPIPRTPDIERKIHQAKTRLKTMLHCQYSFGSVVGAPVIFFLGGFIFALLQSLDTLGDEDIAEGLAFGQWYMTIPHIAIISGLLLAGNNPNILEGVLAVERNYRQDNIKILGFTYGLSYPSCYKVASLWDRGHNKKQWLNTLIDTYLVRHNAASDDNGVYDGINEYDKDIIDLKKKTTLSLSDWILLLALTMTLLGLPFVLAFLTAYYTPEVGLSCRSLTFTIYLLVQTCQIILWLWAYAGPLAVFSVERPGIFRVGGWLDQHGFYQPYEVRWLVGRGEAVPRNPFKLLRVVWKNPHRLANWRLLWNLLYFPSQWILAVIGISAALGGTVMQVIGVYSADICYLTTDSWFLPLPERPQAVISVNSAEMIVQSELMWKPCAITAIVFMSAVSFIGWWYQRRMRDLFTDQVRRIDQNERSDTRASRPDRGRTRPRILTPAAPSVMRMAPTPRASNYGLSTGYATQQQQQQGGQAAYGSLASQGSGMAMMSGAISGAGPSASVSAAGGSGGPQGSAAGSSGGRTPSPLGGVGGLGAVPLAGGGGGGGGGGLPSGAAVAAGADPGVVGAAGPSRRTPYRRTPSPNAPLDPTMGASYIN